MKIPIRSQFTRARHFIWHCLWVTLLFVLFQGGIALAVPVNIPDPPGPNPDHPINATVGQPIVGENIGTNAGGDVFWGVVTPPAGCGPSSPYNCNGVIITVPDTSVDAVPNTAETTVSGTPTAPGNFTFRLVVTSEDGTQTGERTFNLNIREPFDLSFVLDRSGSMGGSTGITPPATSRWNALETGVNGFTPLIQSTAPSGSQFGLTLFSTNVLANNSFSSGLVNIDNSLAGNVNTELNSQTPSGATAMGAGLKAGIAKMTDTSRPRVVVLFTDGEQNRSPQVNLNGQGYSDGTSVNPSYPAGPGSVKIFTVGVGSPSADYLTTLQNLASQNRGTYISTSDGCDFIAPGTPVVGACPGNIQQAFDNIIAPALSGNSPLMVDYFSGILSSTPETVGPFALNSGVKQLLIKLSFSRNFEIPELQDLLAGISITKDGTDNITSSFQPTIVGNYTNSVILSTNFVRQESGEQFDSAGSYKMELTKPSSIQKDLKYGVIPYADDSRLDMDWKVEPTNPRVNQPFKPTVTLSWRGKPLTGATVEAFILNPGDNLGDLLSENPLTVDPSSAPDAGSPGYQKYLQLVQKDPEFLKQLAFNENKVLLTDQGDGNYNKTVNADENSGIHQIFYTVSAKDPDLGTDIQRLAVESAYLRFDAIDLGASSVNTTVIDNNTIQINWRPITTGGHFMGPGNCSAITIDGIKRTDCLDLQNGEYTLTLSGNPETPILVKVLEEPIYKGNANLFGPGKSGILDIGSIKDWPLWLIILIVVLILLLLVLLIWFLRRGESESENNGDS